MTEQQWLALCFKVVLITDVAAIAAWIGTYSRLAPWWHNPIGRSLVLKPALLALALIPAILASFFKLSSRSAEAVGWADVAIFALIAGVMAWRTVIWVRLQRASLLPSAMEKRLAECEAEVASLRTRLGLSESGLRPARQGEPLSPGAAPARRPSPPSSPAPSRVLIPAGG